MKSKIIRKIEDFTDFLYDLSDLAWLGVEIACVLSVSLVIIGVFIKIITNA